MLLSADMFKMLTSCSKPTNSRRGQNNIFSKQHKHIIISAITQLFIILQVIGQAESQPQFPVQGASSFQVVTGGFNVGTPTGNSFGGGGGFGADVNIGNGVVDPITYEFSIDLTFGGPNLLDEFLGNDTQLFNVLSHGCWCAKLDATNIFRPFLGGKPVDELDQICHDWFHDRICNARRSGGYCIGDVDSDTYQVDIIPRDQADCRFHRDDDPLDVFTICEYNTCEVDVKYAKLIEEFLDDHPYFNPHTVTEPLECDRRFVGIVDYYCPTNTAPEEPADEEYEVEGSFTVADWSRPETNNPSTVFFTTVSDAKISFKLRKWFVTLTETALFQLGTGLDTATGKIFLYPGIFFEAGSLDMVFKNANCDGQVDQVRIPTNFTVNNIDEVLVEIYLREPENQLRVKIAGVQVLNVPWFKFCTGSTHELLYSWQLPPADVDMMDLYYEVLNPLNATTTAAPPTTTTPLAG